jgi:hypothetical protein
MPLDEKLVQEALAVRERCGELELQLAQEKADFGRAIRRLHAAGSSLREIADALELSHQRVHQLVEGSARGGWIARLTRGRSQSRPRSPGFCSFCGASQFDTRKLIAGPGVWICERCIGSATRVASEVSPSADDAGRFDLVPEGDKGLRCNFCGRGLRRAKRIVRAGPSARTICDGCLKLCNQVLDETPGLSR